MKEQSKKYISWFIFAICVVAFYKILDNLGDVTNWIKELISVLMPFIMAVLISYILYLPCSKIENFFKKSKSKFIKSKSRWLSIFTVYLAVFLVILVIFNFVVPTVYQSFTELISVLPKYYEDAINNLKELPEDSVLNKINLTGIIDNLSEIDLKEFFNIERITEYAKGIIGFASTIFDIFVTVIISIYILAERGEIINFAKKFCGAVFNKHTYKNIGKYFRESNEIFFRFVSSQILDGLVVGSLVSIAMSLLGVRYAVLLGFMIGLFNLIPYLGAIIAVVLAVIITIFTGGITQAIWMMIIVIILQQIDANIINPKIIGNSLKISPILIIFSVTVIGSYFGIIGMFLAVPIVAIIKLLIKDFIRYKENLKNADA